MNAVETRKVKQQMKCVVTDLENVVDELNGVTRQLGSLLKQIDRVTYALIQGCEHGLRSPELEEATYKSIIPKLTERDVSADCNSAMRCVHPDGRCNGDPTFKETEFAEDEPKALALCRTQNKTSIDKGTSSEGWSRIGETVSAGSSPQSRGSTSSASDGLNAGLDVHRSMAGHRRGRRTTSQFNEKRQAMGSCGNRSWEGSNVLQKTIFKRLSGERKVTKRDSTFNITSADQGLSAHLQKSEKFFRASSLHGLKTLKRVGVSENHPTKYGHTQDRKLYDSSSMHGRDTNVSFDVLLQNRYNLIPLCRTKLQGEFYQTDSSDSLESARLLADFRDSECESDKITAKFTSHMHNSVTSSETDDIEKGLLQEYEASYNRSVNTWTTYALVHIDNTSEEETVCLEDG
ncbi:uncharacterized protein [Ptychodera flava]|uniref:uncharacterized protein n=1 Tax=Ptychodera flava TaxID=63121 RepID=UPI003969D95D